jgi:hypothetical protein
MDPVTIRVAGVVETVDGVAASRARCLALAKEHPQHWVAAHRANGELVHLIDPSAVVTDEEPEEPVTPLPEQEPMF